MNARHREKEKERRINRLRRKIAVEARRRISEIEIAKQQNREPIIAHINSYINGLQYRLEELTRS